MKYYIWMRGYSLTDIKSRAEVIQLYRAYSFKDAIDTISSLKAEDFIDLKDSIDFTWDYWLEPVDVKTA